MQRLLTSLACLVSACASPAFTSVPIYQAYVSYPPCFRQPVLVRAGTRLMAFAEGRNNTYCSGTTDGFPLYIHVRVSSDNGVTWSARQTLYEGSVDFLAAVYDPATDVTHLLVELDGSKVLYTQSTDGSTWSPPAVINVTTKYPGAIPAVGHGIALDGGLCADGTCSGLAGRLVVPFVCHSSVPPVVSGALPRRGDVACPNCYSCLLVSDDHGSSWAITAITNQTGSREAGVAQLVSGSKQAVVYANERNMGATAGHRWHAISTDSGNTFTQFGADPGLPDPVTQNWTGIVAGVSRFDTPGPSPVRRVVITLPMTSTSRSNFGVYTSTDEAKTWNAGSLLVPGPAGYSDCVQLNDTHVAVLFENGAQEFAQQISFGIFDASDL